MSLAVSSDTHALLCSLERGFSCQPFKTSMFTCLLIVPSWTEACRVWQVLGVRIASRSRMAGDFIDTHSWVCLEFFFKFYFFHSVSSKCWVISIKKSLTEKCSRATDSFQERIFQSQFYIFKSQHFLSFFVLFSPSSILFPLCWEKIKTRSHYVVVCSTVAQVQGKHFTWSVLLRTRFRLDIGILSYSVR